MPEDPPDPLTDATLPALRALVRTVADADGTYRLRCARCGTVPPPVDDCRFPDRERAWAALQVAVAYRARLRRWDPRTPTHALLVEDRSASGRGEALAAAEPAADRLEPAACHSPPGMDGPRWPRRPPNDRA